MAFRKSPGRFHQIERKDADISWTLDGLRHILLETGTDFRGSYRTFRVKIGRIYSIPSQRYMRNMLSRSPSQVCKNSMTIG